MKTIFKNGTYQRVSNEVAEKEVKFGSAKFAPKSEWKSSVRGIMEILGMILFLIFMVLKLTNNIDWSWWWVTSPLWIPFLLIVAVLAIVALVVIVAKHLK